MLQPHARPPKVIRRRTPVYIQSLVQRFSSGRRNEIRGALASYEQKGIAPDIKRRIRDNSQPSDMLVASLMLNSSSGLSGRKMSSIKQKDIWYVHSQTVKELPHEIAYACGFLNSWAEYSIKAIGTIAFLSQIDFVPRDDALGALLHAAKEWGASNYLSFKLAYMKSNSYLDSLNDSEVMVEIDTVLGHRESPGIQYACLENIKDRISLFSVARRHTNTLFEKVDGDFRRVHNLNNLVSTPLSEQDCAAYLLRAVETSLLDTAFALWVALNLEDRFPAARQNIKEFLNPAIYEALDEETSRCSQQRVPDFEQSTEYTAEHPLGIEDRSLSVYRKSSAFLESRTLCRYRNDLDRVIGYRLILPLLKAQRGSYAEPLDSAHLMYKPDELFDIPSHGTDDPTIDNFYRTYLFLRFIENPANLAQLESDQFIFILNNTMALEALMQEEELATMHLNASPEARALISVLALALYRSKSSDPDIDFDFREKLEDYIFTKHQGSVLAFVESLAFDSPQVANYITSSLDEHTLQKMYSLIDSTERSEVVRKEILNSIGYRLNKIELIIEAQSIETRRKVSSLKKYFDSSRMFVDSVAMRRWLSANPSAYTQQYKELLPKITATLSAARKIRGPDGLESTVNFLELASTDQYLVHQIAKDAFREFCSNNEFGIESYLGRRIRHNTLHGVMTKDIDDILGRPEHHSVLAGTPFGMAVQSWYHYYRSYIERMRKEFLQFKGQSKPHALFDSEIVPSEPTTSQNLGRLVQTLRLSGAEMLHDLIIAFCWMQVGPQLEFASSQIRVRMAGVITESLDHHLVRFNGPAEVKIRSALAIGVRSVFGQVAAWFQVPQTGFVPASVSDICNIIDLEYHRAAQPTMFEGNATHIKYYGISVHRVYDCLAVLLQNAFKHGLEDSVVIVNASSRPIKGTALQNLRVSVISTLKPDNVQDSEQRVAAAISSIETGRDMVTEGFSGIKKVKFITKLSEGMPTVDYVVVGSEIELSFEMKVELAPEGNGGDEDSTS